MGMTGLLDTNDKSPRILDTDIGKQVRRLVVDFTPSLSLWRRRLSGPRIYNIHDSVKLRRLSRREYLAVLVWSRELLKKFEIFFF